MKEKIIIFLIENFPEFLVKQYTRNNPRMISIIWPFSPDISKANEQTNIEKAATIFLK